ncbi:PLP-dependent aminotransferase family protein [Alteromonas sediminis]|uniref:PLP-dependent aminotransferase family protein n=1 Tax=Alteromonas sediminis TaxID=2259342 RepID=A0A3N5ZAN7_9ALTE|nr:PLP-dependent aminotransferase family protein [Alteromonas sediminis]RPJ66588.1 PLP-dependent aminotransferase family protein [Alteromonas sediminis]
MLSVVIDQAAQTPKYQQLQNQIESLIQDGRLTSEQKLPSSRELAEVLNISRTSVLKALDNLIAEGVLISQPKRGVFVAKHQPTLSACKVESASAIQPAISANVVLDSGADTRVFPHKVWSKCMRRAWIKPEQGVMEGVYSDGIPALKDQICRYLMQLRGLHCQASQITITAGNRDALSILHHALLSDCVHQVFLEQTSYPQIPSLMQFLQSPTSILKLDGQGAVLPEQIHKGRNLAILTPCRQYPTGISMSSERRQAWLGFLSKCKKEGQPFWCIEDDYDNEFVYQGRVNVPLMQQDTSSSLFFVGSFSKVMFRGLRLGFIVAPKNLSEQVKASQKVLGLSCSSAVQPVLAEFMESGAFTSHLRKMRRHYLSKRNALLSLLKPLAPFYRWESVFGGMHLCLRLKRRYWYLESAIAAEAKYQGFSLTTLSSHYISDDKQYGFLVGFSQPDVSTLEQGIACILAATRICIERNSRSC